MSKNDNEIPKPITISNQSSSISDKSKEDEDELESSEHDSAFVNDSSAGNLKRTDVDLNDDFLNTKMEFDTVRGRSVADHTSRSAIPVSHGMLDVSTVLGSTFIPHLAQRINYDIKVIGNVGIEGLTEEEIRSEKEGREGYEKMCSIAKEDIEDMKDLAQNNGMCILLRPVNDIALTWLKRGADGKPIFVHGKSAGGDSVAAAMIPVNAGSSKIGNESPTKLRVYQEETDKALKASETLLQDIQSQILDKYQETRNKAQQQLTLDERGLNRKKAIFETEIELLKEKLKLEEDLKNPGLKSEEKDLKNKRIEEIRDQIPEFKLLKEKMALENELKSNNNLTSSEIKSKEEKIKAIDLGVPENGANLLGQKQKKLENITTDLSQIQKELKEGISLERIMQAANISVEKLNELLYPAPLLSRDKRQIYVFANKDGGVLREKELGDQLHAIKTEDGRFQFIDKKTLEPFKDGIQGEMLKKYEANKTDYHETALKVIGKPRLRIGGDGALEIYDVKPMVADVDLLAVGMKLKPEEIYPSYQKAVAGEKRELLKELFSKDEKLFEELMMTENTLSSLSQDIKDSFENHLLKGEEMPQDSKLLTNEKFQELSEKFKYLTNTGIDEIWDNKIEGKTNLERNPLLQTLKNNFKNIEVQRENLKGMGQAPGSVLGVVGAMRSVYKNNLVSHAPEQYNTSFTQALDDKWTFIGEKGEVKMIHGEEQLREVFTHIMNQHLNDPKLQTTHMPPNPNWGWEIKEVGNNKELRYDKSDDLVIVSEYCQKLSLKESDLKRELGETPDGEKRAELIEQIKLIEGILDLQTEIGSIAITHPRTIKEGERLKEGIQDLRKRLGSRPVSKLIVKDKEKITENILKRGVTEEKIYGNSLSQNEREPPVQTTQQTLDIQFKADSTVLSQDQTSLTGLSENNQDKAPVQKKIKPPAGPNLTSTKVADYRLKHYAPQTPEISQTATDNRGGGVNQNLGNDSPTQLLQKNSLNLTGRNQALTPLKTEQRGFKPSETVRDNLGVSDSQFINQSEKSKPGLPPVKSNLPPIRQRDGAFDLSPAAPSPLSEGAVRRQSLSIVASLQAQGSGSNFTQSQNTPRSPTRGPSSPRNKSEGQGRG